MQLRLAGTLREIDLLVFDCDGVLLDTLPAKIKAFRRWVPAEHDQHAEAFMHRVMRGFGQSRSRHIEAFYSGIVGIKPEAAFLESEIRRFTEICEPMCADAGWRTGSREFVDACAREGVLRYVLSGTPQEPLEEMLMANGGAGLFDRIVGSPPAKPESMVRILEETGVSAERAVFVGDADADRLAAMHVGAHFAYIPSEAVRPEGQIWTEVGDLRELLR